MFLIHLASIIAVSAGQTPIGSGGGNISIGTGNPPSSYIWRGYGGDPYHNAISTVAGQPVSKLHWKAALDGDRTYYGSVLFIHYASPAITAGNTVVHSYRYTTTVNGQVGGKHGLFGSGGLADGLDERIPARIDR
jgi:hypothetical protein